MGEKEEKRDYNRIKWRKNTTFVLFFLQEDDHHLLPDPSMTPLPWKLTWSNFEKKSQILGFLGSQLLGSAGATTVPSIYYDTYNTVRENKMQWHDQFWKGAAGLPFTEKIDIVGKHCIMEYTFHF